MGRKRCPNCYGRLIAHCTNPACRWWLCAKGCGAYGDRQERWQVKE